MGEVATVGATALPADLEAMASDLGLDDDGYAVEGSVSVPHIRLRSRQFSFVAGGEVVATANEIVIVVVGWTPHVGRLYFSSPWNEDDPAPPACWSEDGERPASEVAAPQSSTCRACPMNQRGSDARGKGRACSFVKRLAVFAGVRDGSKVKWLDGVWALQLKGLSLFGQRPGKGFHNWKDYSMLLKQHGVKPFQMATRVKFAEEDVPALAFAPAGGKPLPVDFIRKVLQLWASIPKPVREMYTRIGAADAHVGSEAGQMTAAGPAVGAVSDADAHADGAGEPAGGSEGPTGDTGSGDVEEFDDLPF